MILIGTLAFLFGLMFGAIIIMQGISNVERIQMPILKRILRSSRDGWALVQSGSRYLLKPITRENGQAKVEIDGENEVFEFGDRMHKLLDVPLGLALESQLVGADVETAVVADNVPVNPNGENLDLNQNLTIDDLMERLKIGEIATEAGRFVFVNPFVHVDRSQIVDLRPITKLLRYDGSSDMPRKAAKNAVEAERNLEGTDWGEAVTYGAILSAFLLGAISSTYIGGGGGGGGGINIGLMIQALL